MWEPFRTPALATLSAVNVRRSLAGLLGLLLSTVVGLLVLIGSEVRAA
jgi:hypothetical protein